MQGDLETVSSDPFRLDPLSPSRRADAPTLALDLHRRWCRSGNWYRRLGRDPTSLERVDSILEEGYAVAIRLSEQHIRLEQKPPTSRPARGTLPREVAPGSLPDRTSEYPRAPRRNRSSFRRASGYVMRVEVRESSAANAVPGEPRGRDACTAMALATTVQPKMGWG